MRVDFEFRSGGCPSADSLRWHLIIASSAKVAVSRSDKALITTFGRLS